MKKIFGIVTTFALVLGLFAPAVNAGFKKYEPPQQEECVEVTAPDPVEFSENIAPKGEVNATYKWFEETEGTWVLKVDVNPSGDIQDWQSNYPSWWGTGNLFTNPLAFWLQKPVELPQTIVENDCPDPEPQEEKSVLIKEACDGTALVTIHGGDTRRTWKVEGVEKWIDFNETETFEASSLDVEIYWKHNGEWKLADEEYVMRVEASDCEEEEETSTGTPGTPPTFPGSTTEAPQCGDVAPTKTMANFHVVRNGTQAEMKWVPTDGSKAHFYYKEDFESTWKHALRDTDNNGNAVIRDLHADRTYQFAGQQVNGCAGGPLSNVVTANPTAGLYR